MNGLLRVRLTLLVALALVLAACSGGDQAVPEPSQTSSASASPAPAVSEPAGLARDRAMMESPPPNLAGLITPRPDLVGKTLDEVTAQEQRAGHTIRVLPSDGFRRGDLRPSRVNLYLQDGRVLWAGMF